MNHNDIRHKLSEYLDGSVTAEEKTSIEEHLKTCRTCSDALDELQKTVEHIKSVEEVEPPAWMTQKIMANVREEAEGRKSIVRRFFYPLAVKLPVQAVALLFLAVSAYYLYQNISPADKYAQAPAEKTEATKPTAPALSPPTEPGLRREPVAPAKKVPQSPEYKALDMKQEYEKPAPPSAAGKAAESASSPAAAKGAPEPTEKIKEGRSDEVSQKSRQVYGLLGEVEPARRFAAGEEPRAEGASQAARAKAALAEGRAEIAADLTIKVKDIDAAQKEIEKAVTASGGKMIRTAMPADSSVITISIDRDKAAEFLSKLKTIGDMKENAAAPTSGAGLVTMRISLTIN